MRGNLQRIQGLAFTYFRFEEEIVALLQLLIVEPFKSTEKDHLLRFINYPPRHSVSRQPCPLHIDIDIAHQWTFFFAHLRQLVIGKSLPTSTMSNTRGLLLRLFFSNTKDIYVQNTARIDIPMRSPKLQFFCLRCQTIFQLNPELNCSTFKHVMMKLAPLFRALKSTAGTFEGR